MFCEFTYQYPVIIDYKWSNQQDLLIRKELLTCEAHLYPELRSSIVKILFSSGGVHTFYINYFYLIIILSENYKIPIYKKF